MTDDLSELIIEPTTVELSEREVIAVRDALVESMQSTCKILRAHLNEHLGGNRVALVDARTWLGMLADLVGVMDKLDPPGWGETLGPNPRAHGPVARVEGFRDRLEAIEQFERMGHDQEGGA